MKRIVFKAQLGDGPIQEVGGYEFLSDEWEEQLRDHDGDEASWLSNTGVDWAHEAVHSDCLKYWAEVEK